MTTIRAEANIYQFSEANMADWQLLLGQLAINGGVYTSANFIPESVARITDEFPRIKDEKLAIVLHKIETTKHTMLCTEDLGKTLDEIKSDYGRLTDIPLDGVVASGLIADICDWGLRFDHWQVVDGVFQLPREN